MNALTKMLVKGRERMNLDQRDVAKLAGLDPHFVAMAEIDACAVPLFAVCKIAETLGFSEVTVTAAFARQIMELRKKS